MQHLWRWCGVGQAGCGVKYCYDCRSMVWEKAAVLSERGERPDWKAPLQCSTCASNGGGKLVGARGKQGVRRGTAATAASGSVRALLISVFRARLNKEP